MKLKIGTFGIFDYVMLNVRLRVTTCTLTFTSTWEVYKMLTLANDSLQKYG